MRTRKQNLRCGPVLLGKPSPSLARINKMNAEELIARIDSLSTERARLARRIEHLKIQDPVPQQRIDRLSRQIRRLAALQKTAGDRLAEKQEQRRLRG